MTDLAPVKGMTEAQIATTVEAILEATSLEEKVVMISGEGCSAIRVQPYDQIFVWGQPRSFTLLNFYLDGGHLVSSDYRGVDAAYCRARI